MPKVSIITTTYKHKNFIIQTIESVLAQTFLDRELLIGDDSPDIETWEIIQQYVKKYPHKIRAWHHKPNKGLVENMRFLCNHSSLDSEYYAFLEGDDMRTDSYLQKKIDIFTANPAVELVYNDIHLIDSSGEIFRKNFFVYKGYTLYKNYHSKDVDVPVCSYSSSMVRKSIYNKTGGIPNHNSYSLSSDNAFHYIISSQYDVYGIDEALTLYRRHSENTSSNYLKLYRDANKDNEILFSRGISSETTYNRKKIVFALILAFDYSYVEKGECKRQLKTIWKNFQRVSPIQKIKFFLICILYILPSSISKIIARLYYKITTRMVEDKL